MSTQHPANIPIALSEARRQLDHWRSQHLNKRTRLPKEFWQKAVALARGHGFNKTARALNVKYDSLKKHFDATSGDTSVSSKTEPDFIELLPGTMTSGGVAKPQRMWSRFGR
jgi:hypothetical protein